MFVEGFRVESPRVRYGDGEIESEYRYDTTEVVAPPSPEKGWVVRPKSVTYHFKTTTTVPKLGYAPITLADRSICPPIAFDPASVLFSFSFSSPVWSPCFS